MLRISCQKIENMSKIRWCYCLLLLLLVIVSCKSNDNPVYEGEEFPINAVKPEFIKIKQDTLTKIKEFDEFSLGNSVYKIGNISFVNFSHKYIYFLDEQQSKIYVLNRKTLELEFVFGEGPGKSPMDMNDPFGLEFKQDTLLIKNRTGANLLHYYSPEGKLFKTIPRKSLSSNINQIGGFLAFGDTLIYTQSIAWNRHKGIRLVLDSLPQSVEIFPVEHFRNLTDTSAFKNAVSDIFLSSSKKEKDSFYAVLRMLPLINKYNTKGDLIYSYNLRGVRLLDQYYTQMRQIMPLHESSTVIYSFYSNVINDGEDRFIFPVREFLDMSKIEIGPLGFPDASHPKKYYFVRVDPEAKTYTEYSVDFPFMPLKVIDNNLFCYDFNNSKIVVYNFPSD
jgi:hypothetical protein